MHIRFPDPRELNLHLAYEVVDPTGNESRILNRILGALTKTEQFESFMPPESQIETLSTLPKETLTDDEQIDRMSNNAAHQLSIMFEMAGLLPKG